MTGTENKLSVIPAKLRALLPRSSANLALYFFLQGIGVMTSFLTIFALARVSGADVQGSFFTHKTFLDFSSAVIIFGLPQAFVFTINKEISDERALSAFSVAYCILAAIAAVVLSALHFTLEKTGGAAMLPSVAFMTVGITGYIMHGLARGIILPKSEPSRFAAFSIAPQVSLFAACVSMAASGATDLLPAIALSGLISGMLGLFLILKRASIDFSRLGEVPYLTLLSQSFQTFLQGVLYAAQPVITIYMLGSLGATDSVIGNFSIAVVLLSAVNTLSAMAAPLLFNRWSQSLTWGSFKTLERRTLVVAGALACIGAPAVFILSFAVTSLLGSQYSGAIAPVQVISLAILPLLFTRILTSAVHALGHPTINTISCATRLIVVAGSLFFLAALLDNILVAAAVAWLAGEWSAFVAQIVCVGRAFRKSARMTEQD